MTPDLLNYSQTGTRQTNRRSRSGISGEIKWKQPSYLNDQDSRKTGKEDRVFRPSKPDELDSVEREVPTCGPKSEVHVVGGFRIPIPASGIGELEKLLISLNLDDAAAHLRSVALAKGITVTFSASAAPRKIDEMTGVIREIGNTDVAASLFRDHEEFWIEIPRTVFEEGKVDLREDEGFFFWVDRYADGTEKPVVRPLPSRELSPKDLKDIDRKIAELLDGE